jgi:hypothetical protein
MSSSSPIKALFVSAIAMLALVPACGGAEGDSANAKTQPTSNAVRAAPLPSSTVAPADACGPANCAGCCDADGVCKGGGLPEFCGKGGIACNACAIADGERCGVCQGITACYFHSDPFCQPQVPAAAPLAAPDVACGPGNCTGCCDASGVCRPGTGNALCGMGGEACNACSPRIDGTKCETCDGVTACYFLSQPCN